MDWILKKFEELSVDELYALLRLRSEVFVMEQKCLFLDIDDRDQQSYHLMGKEAERLLAYTRIVPPGVTGDLPSIGRVVTSPQARGRGIGKALMEKSIEETHRLFGKQPIRIGAQLYLKQFYSSLGFVQTSEIYLDDGIEHIEMIRS